MTHIVCMVKTDDGIEIVGRPYALHPMCGKEEAELEGCGILFRAMYCGDGDHAIFALPSGDCLTSEVDDGFFTHAYSLLIETYGEDIWEDRL